MSLVTANVYLFSQLKGSSPKATAKMLNKGTVYITSSAISCSFSVSIDSSLKGYVYQDEKWWLHYFIIKK